MGQRSSTVRPSAAPGAKAGVLGLLAIPYRMLIEAVRAVPAVKYALGVAGIVSAIAIVSGLGVGYSVAVFGTVITFVLMVVLVVFAKLTTTAPTRFLIPAMVLMWSSLILTVATAVLLFTCVFFKKPIDLQQWLRPAGPVEADTSGERQRAKELVDAARLQTTSLDYANAWRSVTDAIELQPNWQEAQQAQVEVAMAWVRDMRVPADQGFSRTVDPLLSCLTRAAPLRHGREQADVLAHIGYAYWLKWRDGDETLDPAEFYRRAVASDPENSYAHAMWGNWMVMGDRRSEGPAGRLEAAKEHFAHALKGGRAREFVRRLQLIAVGDTETSQKIELIRILNDMRVCGETLDLKRRGRAFSSTYYFGLRDLLEQLPVILPAADHLKTFNWLTEGMGESQSDIRRFWLARLTEATGDHAKALDLYLDLASGSYSFDEEVQSGIKRCEAHGGDSIAILVRGLSGGSPAGRAAAADALGRIHPDPKLVTAPLVKALADPDPSVRSNAAHALGTVGGDPNDVVPALAGSMKDSTQSVRAAATEALSAIGTPAVPALISALRHDDPRVRRNAATALSQIEPKPADAVPALSQNLGDAAAEVRKAAAMALAEMGPAAKAAVPALERALRTSRDPDCRATVARALGSIGPDAEVAVKALIEALEDALQDAEDGAGFRSASIAWAFSGIGPGAKDAVPVLIKALDSDHLRVGVDAAEALGRIGADAKEAIPALIRALNGEEAIHKDIQAKPLSEIATSLAARGDVQSIGALEDVLRAMTAAKVEAALIEEVRIAINSLRGTHR